MPSIDTPPPPTMSDAGSSSSDEDEEAYPLVTRPAQQRTFASRLHVMATFMLAFMVLLMATAVMYDPFHTEWNEVVTVAKVMAPVGRGDRCAAPCTFYTGNYPSPLQALALEPATPCRPPSPKQSRMAAAAARALGHPTVHFEWSCNLTGLYTGTAAPVLFNARLFDHTFNDLRIAPLYLSYVGLPLLLANGTAPAVALAAVVEAANNVQSDHRYPHVSQRDLVEAAAVQVLCGEGTPELAVAEGLGCTK